MHLCIGKALLHPEVYIISFSESCWLLGLTTNACLELLAALEIDCYLYQSEEKAEGFSPSLQQVPMSYWRRRGVNF